MAIDVWGMKTIFLTDQSTFQYEQGANRIKHSTILNYDSMVELTRKVLTLELHRG